MLALSRECNAIHKTNVNASLETESPFEKCLCQDRSVGWG